MHSHFSTSFYLGVFRPRHRQSVRPRSGDKLIWRSTLVNDSVENVTLRPMTETEFPAFKEQFLADWASDISRVDDISLTEARKEAERRTETDFRAGLQGLDAKGHHLLVIEANGTPVGNIWFSIQTESAFLDDITVAPQCRGRGYGGRALKLMEQELQRRGVSRVRLSVDANNPRAIKLYKRYGYAITGYRMAKHVCEL